MRQAGEAEGGRRGKQHLGPVGLVRTGGTRTHTHTHTQSHTDAGLRTRASVVRGWCSPRSPYTLRIPGLVRCRSRATGPCRPL